LIGRWRAFLYPIRNSFFVPQVEQAFWFEGFHRFDYSLSTGAGEFISRLNEAPMSLCTEWDRAEADPVGNGHISSFSSAPARRTSSQKRAGVRGAVAVLGLMGATLTSPSHAQAPSLGTAGSFGVLAGSTVTNTGSTVINGDVGVSPGSAITGFPPGIVVNGTIHAADAVAGQAQIDNTNAYNVLAGMPITTRACRHLEDSQII
jgi:Ice-binding-like